MADRQSTTPWVVALSGGIGSGKSTIAALFAFYNVPVVDCDVLAHQLTEVQGEALVALELAFGKSVFFPNGSLNRAALRQLVFSDKQKKTQLENILHPLIRTEVLAFLHTAQQQPYVLLVVPLLCETRFLMEVIRFILVVDAGPDCQLHRVLQRENMTEDIARRIINSQSTRQQRYIEADGWIDNDCDRTTTALEKTVQHWHQRFVAMSCTQ